MRAAPGRAWPNTWCPRSAAPIWTPAGLKWRGLRFEALDRPFAFSVLPYSAMELENAAHGNELPEDAYTFVTIAGAVRGVGGDDSWGAPVYPEYCIKRGGGAGICRNRSDGG